MLRDTSDPFEKKDSSSNNLLLLDLPSELVLYIFSFLSIREISLLLITSREAARLADDQMIWRNLCATAFSDLKLVINKQKEVDYKKTYSKPFQNFEYYFPYKNGSRQFTSMWVGTGTTILTIFESLRTVGIEPLFGAHQAISCTTNKDSVNLSLVCQSLSLNCSEDEFKNLQERASSIVVVKSKESPYEISIAPTIKKISSHIKMNPQIFLLVLELCRDEHQRCLAKDNIDINLQKAIIDLGGTYLAVTVESLTSLIVSLENIASETCNKWPFWTELDKKTRPVELKPEEHKSAGSCLTM